MKYHKRRLNQSPFNFRNYYYLFGSVLSIPIRYHQFDSIQVQTSITGRVCGVLFRNATTFSINKRNYHLNLSILNAVFFDRLLIFCQNQVENIVSYISHNYKLGIMSFRESEIRHLSRTLSEQRPNTYFNLIEKVGDSGKYQSVMLFIFLINWFVTGIILLSTAFLFRNRSFDCIENGLLINEVFCTKYVCQLPSA